MTSKDPLLQPFQLKHLTLRNRIMSSAHEPSYSEDGMPKDRYRLYHVEKAKGGIALTMTAGSATSTPTRTRSCLGSNAWLTTATNRARR
jgi:2,4-dienoyl-CoA reductase-like NADH-dependent reductase (Old Yellow Enzyme family)